MIVILLANLNYNRKSGNPNGYEAFIPIVQEYS